ncbi:hypothetical protein BDV41DRAFT_517 [Aspergillus transmontanensis]|uniref:Uncharacterized protein n=1 Tax=Aspergillus transmontanensis TaxID=1034304 RepID=A0A5N6WKF0_9EURO|nr:hypothetical protein BDV41DRAFT_517 [Aspergillus transmontanensis]
MMTMRSSRIPKNHPTSDANYIKVFSDQHDSMILTQTPLLHYLIPLKRTTCWPHTIFPVKHLPTHKNYTTRSSQISHISNSSTYGTIPTQTLIQINDQPGLSPPLKPAPYATLDLELYNQARYDLICRHQRVKWHATHSSLPKEVRLDYSQQAISPYENHGIEWRDSNPRHDYQIIARCRFDMKQDLRHRRLIVMLFIVGALMQACFLTSQNYKDVFPAEDVISQGSARLIESRRRRVSCLGLGDAQVERFLLKRDPSGEGVTGSERMVYREALPYCSYGGGINGSGIHVLSIEGSLLFIFMIVISECVFSHSMHIQ